MSFAEMTLQAGTKLVHILFDKCARDGPRECPCRELISRSDFDKHMLGMICWASESDQERFWGMAKPRQALTNFRVSHQCCVEDLASRLAES